MHNASSMLGMKNSTVLKCYQNGAPKIHSHHCEDYKGSSGKTPKSKIMERYCIFFSYALDFFMDVVIFVFSWIHTLKYIF